MAQFAFAQSNSIREMTGVDLEKSFIEPLSNGGYVVAGYKRGAGLGLTLAAFDGCDNIDWSVTLATPNEAVRLAEMVVTKSNDILLWGYIFTNNSSQNHIDGILVKVSSEGRVKWTKSYHANYNDIAYSLGESPQGHYYLYGNQTPTAGQGYNFIIKADTSGNILWSRNYLPSGLWGRGISTSDGGFLVCNSGRVYKVDSAGDVQWINQYSDLSYPSRLLEADEGYVLAKYEYSPDQSFSFVLKLNKNGTLAWTSHAYPFQSAGSVEKLPNGNLAVLSPSKTFWEIGSSDGRHIRQVNLGGHLLASGIDYCQLSNGRSVFLTLENVLHSIDSNMELSCGFVELHDTTGRHMVIVTPEQLTASNAAFQVNSNTFDIVDNPINITFLCGEPMPYGFPLLTPDTTICRGKTITIDLEQNSSATYLWDNGQTTSSRSISQEGSYHVDITICDSTLRRDIDVNWGLCDCEVTLHNAFTPNNDGVNETYGPVFECWFEKYEFQVFNRWGTLVFMSIDPSERWDGSYQGEKQPAGVYFSTLKYSTIRLGTPEEQTLATDVTLIR